MKKFLLAILAGVGLVAVSLVLIKTRPIAAQTQQSAAVFDSEGRLQAPDPTVFRKWVFVGAPLTPNALNNGKANFPEYHHVYIEEKNVDAYLKTGSFPEGTMIVKELTRVLDVGFSTASTTGSTQLLKTVNGSPKPMAGAFSLSDIIRCHPRRQLRSPPQPCAPTVTSSMSPQPT